MTPILLFVYFLCSTLSVLASLMGIEESASGLRWWALACITLVLVGAVLSFFLGGVLNGN